MRFDVLSLFPSFFKSPLETSILGRAILQGLIEVGLVNIRDYAHDRVDDRPYGGGPGMVLAAQPVCGAVRHVKQEKSHVIYLSPQGKLLNATYCKHLASLSHLILICGHYEGIDQRAIELEVDEEISIGDYVLTNGCLAALVLMDAVSRFVEGVLGHELAAEEDSFQNGLFDTPHYTRPFEFEGLTVPEVLLSGHHEAIRAWRKQKGYEKTRVVRPDLLY